MLRRLVGAFDQAAAIVAGALVVALLADVSLGAITRSLGDPLIWTDELARFLMVWLAVAGWIVASRKRLHVRIRFFQDLLPFRVHRAVEVTLQLAMLLFGALILVYGVGLVAKNRDLEATTLPIAMAWMYVPLLPAGAVTLAQALHELVAAFSLRASGESARVEGPSA
ncbi:MAG TPA: TRAP transporter small permease [Casimicrobiaceae bacterium]|nr:TRAP transporter small permease [Casimicrobiaceae bacterium]